MTGQRKTGFWRRLKGLMVKRTHRMITCKEFEAFVQGYLDGELSARRRSVFEWHLRICRECREYLSAYQRAMELSRTIFPSGDEPVPEDVPEDLIKAILDARER